MNGLLLWTTSAVFGAAAVLMTSLGLLAALLFLLAACALLVRGRPLSAASGLLSGFGACWLLFLSRQASTGGSLDNAAWWVGVGAVLLAIVGGLAALPHEPWPPVPSGGVGLPGLLGYAVGPCWFAFVAIIRPADPRDRAERSGSGRAVDRPDRDASARGQEADRPEAASAQRRRDASTLGPS